jgi:uncharacterized ferredoxin-like protein
MINENDIKSDSLLKIAGLMSIAARTAPKGRGISNLDIKIASGEDLEILANKMTEISKLHNQAFFERDAKNIRNSTAVILLGIKLNSLGLKYCGLCGFDNCEAKSQNQNFPCTFNNIELGIAIGSAVSVAAMHHVDNRIMYTVGMAARDLKIFDDRYKIIMGIAISAENKNIYFDRA